MKPFQLGFLDHVAIKVKDLDASIAWYEKVLGLEKRQLPEWGSYPTLMLAGRFGVALFQSKGENSSTAEKAAIKIDHFAFNVNKADFEAALQHYQQINIEYQIQDHFYFRSIYTKDPDGNTVELTTLSVDESSFYK